MLSRNSCMRGSVNSRLPLKVKINSTFIGKKYTFNPAGAVTFVFENMCPFLTGVYHF